VDCPRQRDVTWVKLIDLERKGLLENAFGTNNRDDAWAPKHLCDRNRLFQAGMSRALPTMTVRDSYPRYASRAKPMNANGRSSSIRRRVSQQPSLSCGCRPLR